MKISMQYGVDIPTYKRTNSKKEKKRIKLKSGQIKLTFLVVIGLLLSRVGFGVIDGLYMAPFGVAYLLTIINKKTAKEVSFISLAISIGYISRFNINKDTYIYLIILGVSLLFLFFSNILKREVNHKYLFIVLISIFSVVEILTGEKSIGVNFVFGFIKSLTIIPAYYMISYAINCIDEMNTDYFFSTEELISMAILLCLSVVGIGNLSLLGIGIKEVIGISIVIVVAYATGCEYGAVLGVTMGFVMGIGSNNISISMALYPFCGVIIGLFRETGKIISVISYLVAGIIVLMYGNELNGIKVVELLLPAIFVLFMPMEIIKSILREISNEEKNLVVSSIQVEGIKSEFSDRLLALKSTLGIIAKSISSLSENDKLLVKNKGTALVESLVDRVCKECEMNGKCWGRELHSTFSDFSQLILSCEERKVKIPSDLNVKCVKRNTLLKSAEELFSDYTVNEALKSRLVEGRNIIAKQINNISDSMGEVLRDFQRDVTSCLDIDKLLRKTLTQNGVKYREVYSYTDNKGRLKIKVKLDNCEGNNYCIRKILPLISDLIRMPLCLSDEGCRINPNSNECSVTIEESPKYHAVSYVEYTPKDGEKYSGDSYNFGKNKNGQYITAISDGMGSGPQAGLESTVALNLIDSFMDNGFGEKTTFSTVNSIMGMKFDDDEKFTTLDMNYIDLYTGETSFIKMGAVASFIKRGKEIEVISKSSLPFGVVDNVDTDVIKKKLKQGDIIITISDGILDADKNNVGDTSWLVEYLRQATTNPQELSSGILNAAKSLSNGRVLDDMTVVVSKLYSAY